MFIHGFIRSHGKLTAFDYPGASITVASGINNHGTIVGIWTDSAGNQWGFVLIK